MEGILQLITERVRLPVGELERAIISHTHIGIQGGIPRVTGFTRESLGRQFLIFDGQAMARHQNIGQPRNLVITTARQKENPRKKGSSHTIWD